MAGRSDKKFFFDHHNFDDDVLEKDDVDLPPPPPVFTEAEMEAAQKQAFERGLSAGLAESKASREQFIANTLQKVFEQFKTLFGLESLREKQYEAESLALAAVFFRKAFPFFNQSHGPAEVLEIIRSAIADQEGLSEIVVELHPDLLNDVKELLDRHTAEHPATRFTIKPQENMGPGDCRLTWKDGGAVRNADALSAKIMQDIEGRLAASGAKVQNGLEGRQTDSGENS